MFEIVVYAAVTLVVWIACTLWKLRHEIERGYQHQQVRVASSRRIVMPPAQFALLLGLGMTYEITMYRLRCALTILDFVLPFNRHYNQSSLLGRLSVYSFDSYSNWYRPNSEEKQ